MAQIFRSHQSKEDGRSWERFLEVIILDQTLVAISAEMKSDEMNCDCKRILNLRADANENIYNALFASSFQCFRDFILLYWYRFCCIGQNSLTLTNFETCISRAFDAIAPPLQVVCDQQVEMNDKKKSFCQEHARSNLLYAR